jgi:hypothetical protein
MVPALRPGYRGSHVYHRTYGPALHVLLAWLRTRNTMTEATRTGDIKAFDAILASITFSDRAVAAAQPVGKTSSSRPRPSWSSRPSKDGETTGHEYGRAEGDLGRCG